MNASILKTHIHKVNKVMSYFLIFLAAISIITAFVANMHILLINFSVFVLSFIFIIFSNRKKI